MWVEGLEGVNKCNKWQLRAMREQERKKTSAILDQEMKAEKVEATLVCTSAGKVTAASQAWHLSLLFDVI